MLRKSAESFVYLCVCGNILASTGSANQLLHWQDHASCNYFSFCDVCITNGINYPVPMVSLQVLLHELSTTRQRTRGKRNQAKRSYDGTPDLNSVVRFRLLQSLRISQCVNQLNANYLQFTRFFSILFHFFHSCHLF